MDVTRWAGAALAAAWTCVASATGLAAPALAHGGPAAPLAAAVDRAIAPRTVSVSRHRGRRAELRVHSETRRQLRDVDVVATDARRALASVRPAAVASQALPDDWCGAPLAAGLDNLADAVFGSTAATIKVVYAHAADRPDRFERFAPLLQADAALAARYVSSESGGAKTIRFDMGTSCGARYLDIVRVRLPGPAASYIGADGLSLFDDLAGDVAAVVGGVRGQRRSYVVYADGLRGAGGIVGTGQSFYGAAGELAGSTNIHNRGGLVAVIWGSAGFTPASGDRYVEPATFVHELFHTLGAVQDSAPHATGAGHCTDEADVMCYADGGPNDAPIDRCATRRAEIDERLDCGGDDYFSASPEPGSWLATHWNTFDSAFLGPCAELADLCGSDLATGPAPSATSRTASGTLRVLRGGRLARRLARPRVVATGDGQGSWEVALRTPRLRLPAGRWRIRACVDAGGRSCTTTRRTLRRAGRVSVRSVSASVSGAMSATGLVEVRRGSRRYATTADPASPFAVEL